MKAQTWKRLGLWGGMCAAVVAMMFTTVGQVRADERDDETKQWEVGDSLQFKAAEDERDTKIRYTKRIRLKKKSIGLYVNPITNVSHLYTIRFEADLRNFSPDDKVAGKTQRAQIKVTGVGSASKEFQAKLTFDQPFFDAMAECGEAPLPDVLEKAAMKEYVAGRAVIATEKTTAMLSVADAAKLQPVKEAFSIVRLAKKAAFPRDSRVVIDKLRPRGAGGCRLLDMVVAGVTMECGVTDLHPDTRRVLGDFLHQLAGVFVTSNYIGQTVYGMDDKTAANDVLDEARRRMTRAILTDRVPCP